MFLKVGHCLAKANKGIRNTYRYIRSIKWPVVPSGDWGNSGRMASKCALFPDSKTLDCHYVSIKRKTRQQVWYEFYLTRRVMSCRATFQVIPNTICFVFFLPFSVEPSAPPGFTNSYIHLPQTTNLQHPRKNNPQTPPPPMNGSSLAPLSLSLSYLSAFNFQTSNFRRWSSSSSGSTAAWEGTNAPFSSSLLFFVWSL